MRRVRREAPLHDDPPAQGGAFVDVAKVCVVRTHGAEAERTLAILGKTLPLPVRSGSLSAGYR